MASDFKKPFSELTSLLPPNILNEVNSSWLNSLFDPHLTHEEAQRIVGLIGKYFPSSTENRAWVGQANLDRQVNQLVPMLYTEHGTTEYITTFTDLVRKAKICNIDVDNMEIWGQTQAFNFAPPINLDKFANFSNYFWIQGLAGETSWNPTGRPEYYVIAKPLVGAKVKLPVNVATTENIYLNGTKKPNDIWQVLFSTPTTFNVIGDISGFIGGGTLTNGSATFKNTFLSFQLNELQPFHVGDYFTIEVKHLSNSAAIVSFTGQGAGTIYGAKSELGYGIIDGVQLAPGQRILVKNQTNFSENGIYIVSAGNWERAFDCVNSTAIEVFVRNGTTNIGTWETSDLQHWTLLSTAQNLNDWEAGNQWVHRDDLQSLYGITKLDTVYQAERPIIEFSADIELASNQIKTRFNQLPQFNLYWATGTKTPWTSGIFYYAEDPLAPIDVPLQRRVKITESSTFIFEQGLISPGTKRLLTYKLKSTGEIKGIWVPGPKTLLATEPVFVGHGDGGLNSISITSAEFAEEITVQALTATTFSVYGSRSGNLSTAIVGQVFTSPIVSFIVTGTFSVGDYFNFSLIGPEHPRYVTLNANWLPITYPQHPSNDLAGDGTWLTAPHLVFNPLFENREQLIQGDLTNHFVSIIRDQDFFTGSAFGDNNYRNLATDTGLGGEIKVLDSTMNLLLGLLNQETSNPATLIDFAEQQYAIALNSITDYLITNFAQLISNTGSISTVKLFDQYVNYYKTRSELTTAFHDTSSPIPNWPLTLPLIGFCPAIEPIIKYDELLRIAVIVHHDGHKSALTTISSTIEQQFASTIVTRYDGETTPGTIGATLPAYPYNGQLWYDTNNNSLKVLLLQFEGPIDPINPVSGNFWYNRVTNELKQWNGSSWESTNIFPWVEISAGSIIDGVILEAEKVLYNRYEIINTFGEAVKPITAISNPTLLQYELSKFAIANGYDPLGANYIPTDAFSWNYRQADFTTIPILTGIARWHKLYFTYFESISGIGTYRPDLEPWKLLGFAIKPATWDAQYKSLTPPEAASAVSFIGYVTVICQTNIDLNAPNLLIDNFQVSTGNSVLLNGQNNPMENGIYNVVGSQLVAASVNIILDSTVAIQNGTFKNSIWVYDGSLFQQARLWKSQMWQDIIAAVPNIKLCVNPNIDLLLPPYVAAINWESQFALTTSYPAGTAATYQFGDEGPIELIWKNSLAYNYSLARIQLAGNPLNFLKQFWGFQTQLINEVTTDRYTGRLMSQKDFTLHSEPRPNRELTIPQVAIVGTAPTVSTELIAIYQQADGKMLFSNPTGSIIIREGDSVDLPTVSGGQSTLILPYATQLLNGNIYSDNGYQYVIGDKIKIADIAEFIPTTQTSYIGVNQWYTQFLRYNSIDSTIATDVALLRDVVVKLGYRVGALAETDTLKLATDAYGTISNHAYSVKLKTSKLAKNVWAQALRIQVIGIGSKSEYAGLSDSGVQLKKPTEQGTDWVFRIENYFARHPQIEKYVVNPAGLYETFGVLDQKHCKENWYNYIEGTTTELINLPVTIIGIQNVVNFVETYSRFLADQGWEFAYGDVPPTDAVTGRIVGWQLELEKFIDTLYKGSYVDQGIMLNPMLYGFGFKSATGLLAPFKVNKFNDTLTSQFVFDLVGDVIENSALIVTRKNDEAIVKAQVPVFGAHVTITEYEHAILFDNYVNTTGLLFDPFLGIMVEKMVFDGKIQQNRTLRPSFGGYYLTGHEAKKNIAHSIDSVHNYFDADKVFETESTTNHALALFGFNKKSYFKLLDASAKTEFNFWRGLINAKGTNYCIDAFLNSIKYEAATIDEFWAYKLAQYGDSRSNTYPELKINVADCMLKHTRLYFSEAATDVPTESFISITRDDENRWYSISDLIEQLDVKNEGTKLYFQADSFTRTYTTTIADELIEIAPADHFDAFSVNAITDQDDQQFGTLPDEDNEYNFIPVNRTVVRVPTPGTYTVKFFVPAKPKFSPIKLIDYIDSAVIEDITTWHPAFGNHSALAYEILNTISDKDPAKYNYATQTIGNENYEPVKVWGSREVGTTWWDTTNLDYIPYFDDYIFPNFEERLARWGSLADYSKIKVYEWIESNVAPANYDAEAAKDQINADIPANKKRTGTAARKQSYYRDRSWEVRPIAWSYVESPSADSDITILQYGSTELSITSQTGKVTAILNTHKFSDFGIVSGMHISAWKAEIPYGELQLTGTPGYMLGTTFSNGSIIEPLIYDASFFTPNFLSKVVIKWTNNSKFIGSKIGAFKFSFSKIASTLAGSFDYFISLTKTAVAAGDVDYTQKLQITEYLGDEGTTFSLDFQEFGIQLEGTFSNLLPTGPGDIWAELQTIDFDVYVRQYCNGTVLVPFPETAILMSNSIISTAEYQWRAWSIPTQVQLAADLKTPHNSWKPIFGEWVSTQTTSSLISAISTYDKNKLVLNDETTIEYYKSIWGNWIQLQAEQYSAISAEDSTTFTFNNPIVSNRLAVYVNGINQLSNMYSINAKTNTVTVNNIAYGHKIMVILMSYTPTTAELAFDPTIKDDVTVQIQYKMDYQYSAKNVRDSSGNIIGQTYYFWVENKTVPLPDKHITVQQVQQLLISGPATYLTFQKFAENVIAVDPTTGADYESIPHRYKGITVAGLNNLVGKDNTYKLRFTKDFILRDDPNDIHLKNSHTEWLLIRPNQKSKIPEQLWQKLVDSACGVDSVGNRLPSLNRQLYDERHLTNTRYGFGPEQLLAERSLILSSLTNTLLNPKTTEYVNGINTPVVIRGLDYANYANWFSTPESTRALLDFIWNSATAKSINELFFEVLQDALANNYEFTDIFKTSRLSAHSIITPNTQFSTNNANVYY